MTEKEFFEDLSDVKIFLTGQEVFEILDRAIARTVPPSVGISVLGKSGRTFLSVFPSDMQRLGHIYRAFEIFFAMVHESLKAAVEDGKELTNDLISEIVSMHLDSISYDEIRSAFKKI